MQLRQLVGLCLLVLLTPLVSWGAPQGKVVAAQGVDPTTLNPMNHQETSASNLAVNLFDTSWSAIRS